MTIAAKHFDPIIGIDIHIILMPPASAPTPLPNPYIGIVFDPIDYVPVLGATVKINGLPRAQAGTSGLQLMPHLPLGGPFGPPPPSRDSEIFMGSATVAIDGDAQSYLGLPVLSCQSIGIPAPPRLKAKKPKKPAKSLVLPTSVVLSIPMGRARDDRRSADHLADCRLLRAPHAPRSSRWARAIRKLQRGKGRIGNAMRADRRGARSRAGDSLANGAGARRQRPQPHQPRNLHGHGPPGRCRDRQGLHRQGRLRAAGADPAALGARLVQHEHVPRAARSRLARQLRRGALRERTTWSSTARPTDVCVVPAARVRRRALRSRRRADPARADRSGMRCVPSSSCSIDSATLAATTANGC